MIVVIPVQQLYTPCSDNLALLLYSHSSVIPWSQVIAPNPITCIYWLKKLYSSFLISFSTTFSFKNFCTGACRLWNNSRYTRFILGRRPYQPLRRSRVTLPIVRMRNSELSMHAEEGSMRTQKWGFYIWHCVHLVLSVSCIANSLPVWHWTCACAAPDIAMFYNTKKDAVLRMLYFLLGSSCRDDGDSQESRWEKELMEVCDGKWVAVSSSEGESWATVSDRGQTDDCEC